MSYQRRRYFVWLNLYGMTAVFGLAHPISPNSRTSSQLFADVRDSNISQMPESTEAP